MSFEGFVFQKAFKKVLYRIQTQVPACFPLPSPLARTPLAKTAVRSTQCVLLPAEGQDATARDSPIRGLERWPLAQQQVLYPAHPEYQHQKVNKHMIHFDSLQVFSLSEETVLRPATV